MKKTQTLLVTYMVAFISQDMVQALIDVIPRAADRSASEFFEFHSQIARMYSWHRIALRTERAYDAIAQTQVPPAFERMKRFSPFMSYIPTHIYIYTHTQRERERMVQAFQRP